MTVMSSWGVILDLLRIKRQISHKKFLLFPLPSFLDMKHTWKLSLILQEKSLWSLMPGMSIEWVLRLRRLIIPMDFYVKKHRRFYSLSYSLRSLLVLHLLWRRPTSFTTVLLSLVLFHRRLFKQLYLRSFVWNLSICSWFFENRLETH
jgi:hypothetical protein